MFLAEDEKLIREYFDLSDSKTRAMILNEDNSNEQLLSALTNALYDKIVAKVDKIDFGTIPRSRGDITKVDGFENTVECLNIMRQIVLEYHEDPKVVDNVIGAINNVKDHKAQFMKAYATNTEFPMVLYNLITLAIEQSVSFLIAVCIQYIKDPDTGSMVAALDKVAYNNSKENLLYEQLEKFNTACTTKQIDTAIDEVFKSSKKLRESTEEINVPAGSSVTITVSTNNEEDPAEIAHKELERGTDQYPEDLFGDTDAETEPVNGCGNPMNVPVSVNGCDTLPSGVRQPVEEGIIDTAVNVVGLAAKGIAYTLYGVKAILSCAIPILRAITYFFIHTRVKLSDTMAIQAQFLEANARNLEYSDTDMSEDKKKKVVARQLKLAEKLRNWSNKLAIDNKKSQKDAEKDMQEEKKTSTADDLEGTGGDLF